MFPACLITRDNRRTPRAATDCLAYSIEITLSVSPGPAGPICGRRPFRRHDDRPRRDSISASE